MNESFVFLIRNTQDQRRGRMGTKATSKFMELSEDSVTATAIGMGAWRFYAQEGLFQGVIG